VNQFINQMAARAQQTSAGTTGPRQGVITAYDPLRPAVKVQLQPSGEETGWIPFGSIWVGNGWGLAVGPMIGAIVEVTFDNGNIGVGAAGQQFYNDVDQCPGPPSGEFWLFHQSGSKLKFTNDGNVAVAALNDMTYTAQQHHFIGPVQMDNSLNVNQKITSQADIQDNTGTNSNSMAAMRKIFDGHDHTINNVQGGSSTLITTPPVQQE
jgi:hypothetical protein